MHIRQGGTVEVIAARELQVAARPAAGS